MPYGLFDYTPDSLIHTMGGTRPGYHGNNWIQCKDGKWDITNGIAPPCLQDRPTTGQTNPGQITTKAMGEECPTIMPPACPDGSIPRRTGTSAPNKQGCRMPIFAPCPKPKCPTTLTQGGCNYRLV